MPQSDCPTPYRFNELLSAIEEQDREEITRKWGLMQAIKVNSLSEIINMVSDYRLRLVNRWWRGQSNKKWDLVPKAFRRGYDPDRERVMAHRFMRWARTRHAVILPGEANYSGWLCLMQHYGLPTRLLDWSESVAVALWFVVSDEPEEDGALWALDPKLLNSCADLMNKGGPSLDTPVPFEEPVVRPYYVDVFEAGLSYRDWALAVVPPELDLRMFLQRSLFTVHTSQRPLENIIWKKYRGIRGSLVKFIVPKESKERLKDQLAILGIRRSTLFPDLDNLAQDLDENTPAMWMDDRSED